MLTWLLKGRLLYFSPKKKRQGALIGAGALNGANTVVKKLDDCPLEDFFTFAHYNKRGHSFKLEKPRCSLSFTLNQFSHRVINVWNCLPQYVVDAETLNSFKARLDKHWQGNMLYQY